MVLHMILFDMAQKLSNEDSLMMLTAEDSKQPLVLNDGESI